MNATELASLMFPFDPRTNNVLFYGATITIAQLDSITYW